MMENRLHESDLENIWGFICWYNPRVGRFLFLRFISEDHVDTIHDGVIGRWKCV